MRNPHRSRPVFAAFAALAALALGAACDGRPAQSQGTSRADAPPSPNEPLVAELDLSSGVPEAPAMQLFGPSRRRTHFDWVLALRALPDAANVRGLLVHVGPGIGLPRAAELGRLLGEARERGLPVVCHGDEYDQAALLLAAQGCSRTWVSPAGGVDAVGIAMELVFMRELFEKLHVQVDMLQVGKYKGAAEPFTRDDSSPEARASYQRALGSIRHAWIDGITQGKKNPRARGGGGRRPLLGARRQGGGADRRGGLRQRGPRGRDATRGGLVRVVALRRGRGAWSLPRESASSCARSPEAKGWVCPTSPWCAPPGPSPWPPRARPSAAPRASPRAISAPCCTTSRATSP
jgi:hypothetical protein